MRKIWGGSAFIIAIIEMIPRGILLAEIKDAVKTLDTERKGNKTGRYGIGSVQGEKTNGKSTGME